MAQTERKERQTPIEKIRIVISCNNYAVHGDSFPLGNVAVENFRGTNLIASSVSEDSLSLHINHHLKISPECRKEHISGIGMRGQYPVHYILPKSPITQKRA